MINHDIAVEEMLDMADEGAIGLLGRPPGLQFVRLASAFNAKKAELAETQRQVEALCKLVGDQSPCPVYRLLQNKAPCENQNRTPLECRECVAAWALTEARG